MSTINQKEYLKKYLGIGKAPGEKKKKKKKEKSLGNRLKIIDDDVDVLISQEIEQDIAAANEDAPQIVAVIDERPIALQIDEKTKSSLWKPIGEPSSASDIQTLKVNSFKLSKQTKSSDNHKYAVKVKTESASETYRKHSSYGKGNSSTVTKIKQENDIESNSRRTNREVSNSPVRRNERDYDREDTSPPRKRHKNDYSPRRERDTGYSPPRKRNKEDDRKKRDEDSSPPRNRDNTPPLRNKSKKGDRTNSADDNSPPRRKNRDDDGSPPRKNTGDSSPPRKNNRENDSSPPRKRNKEDDNSPPRRRNRDEDNSPPRKNNIEDDASPPRRRNREIDDNSPPQRKNRTEKGRRHENDLSPARIKIKSEDKPTSSSQRDKRSGERKKSRWNAEDSPDNTEKQNKTLDGKRAGLQNAKELSKESKFLRQKEDEMFKNMSAEVSGRNAATVVRAKKVKDLEEEAAREKRQKEMKEKYDRWGKGLKQVEDQNQRMEEQLHEMSKPLARYADDEDLEKFLKEQEREGDPMLAYIRKKKEKVAAGIPEKPMYMGEFMPNRFGIPPGYRWDGVDRSNGYEKKYFQVQNAKRASQEEAFKWSTEDM